MTEPTASPTGMFPRIRETFARLQARLETEGARWRAEIEGELADGRVFRQGCPAHPGRQRGLDVETSVEASYAAGALTHVMEACPDCAGEAARVALARRLGIPARLARATLDNYRCDGNAAGRGGPDGRAKTLALCRDYLARPDGRAPFFLLCGTPGTGKSHLAAALLMGAATPGTGHWADHAALVAEVQSGYEKGRCAERILARHAASDYLVLDEVGGARTSEDARAILCRILRARHEAGRRTIVTSNLTLKAMMAAVLDPRLKSRVAEHYTASPWMGWDDYRRRRK